MQYFALDDTGQRNGVIAIDQSQAPDYNAKNYGIFWAVNEFKDNIRRKENLIHINAWVIDIDKGNKQAHMKKLMRSKLLPSLIVETKAGYHVYWYAENATEANYKAVVEDRLIPMYGGDTRAKDVCRILRVPGYWHCKDPNKKFKIKEVYMNNTFYTEEMMLTFFSLPRVRKELEPFTAKDITKEMASAGTVNLWMCVAGLDPEYAFAKISGQSICNNETFNLVPNTDGTKQIHVNGKSTSSWVDNQGLIGSYDKGGVTIAQWINWYCHDYKEVARFLNQTFGRELNI